MHTFELENFSQFTSPWLITNLVTQICSSLRKKLFPAFTVQVITTFIIHFLYFYFCTIFHLHMLLISPSYEDKDWDLMSLLDWVKSKISQFQMDALSLSPVSRNKLYSSKILPCLMLPCSQNQKHPSEQILHLSYFTHRSFPSVNNCYCLSFPRAYKPNDIQFRMPPQIK